MPEHRNAPEPTRRPTATSGSNSVPGPTSHLAQPGAAARSRAAQDAEAAARAARAKLDQLKDLYLTAEAIGEDALVRHFDEVSQRQHDLIRDYFKQPGLRPSAILRPADEGAPPEGPPQGPTHQAESATHST